MRPSGPGSLTGRFLVADWLVDAHACRLLRGGTEVRLRPLLVDLLVLLASRPGEVVTKDEILDRIWQGRFVSDSVLSRTMTELRHVLQDDYGHPRFIQTIPKRGYRLIATVGGCEPAGEPRLAVLPFENLNGDAEHDYFAAGLSDALTTELSELSGLRVISRHSVLALPRGQKTVPEIARQLRVDAVVEGAALHAGNQIRFTAQLIQADPECHLWARSYVGEMSDLLQLQGRLARAVAGAVQAVLKPQEVARLTRRRSASPEAHLAFLKARHYTARWDRESLDKGFHHVQQALRIDPAYAPAHALLAQAFTILGYWGHLPAEIAYPQAKGAAMRAVRLDEGLGEAHAVLGLMEWLMDWDLEAGDRELRIALELSPSSELVHAFYALFLAVTHRDCEKARALTRQALNLDPISMGTGFFAAWLHLFSEDYSRAISQAATTLEMYPDCLHAHYVLGWVALAELRYGDAVAAFAAAAALSRDSVSIAYLACALGRGGGVEDARGLLRELTGKRDSEEVPEHLFALVHGGLGEFEPALESLERCYGKRDSRIFWFQLAPIGFTLLEDPGFRELMRRVEATVKTSSTRVASTAGVLNSR